jgi:hypothetical protein
MHLAIRIRQLFHIRGSLTFFCLRTTMETSLDERTREIDASNIVRVKRATEEAEKVDKVRRELVCIYREHRPGKTAEIDSLLEKYVGKEADLLAAVKKKYSVTAVSAHKNWSYVLKNYPNEGNKKSLQQQTWSVEQNLGSVRDEIDEIARSIKGECQMIIVGKEGRRKLVVRRRSTKEPICSLSLVEAAVEKMRHLVQQRYHIVRRQQTFQKNTSRGMFRKRLI